MTHSRMNDTDKLIQFIKKQDISEPSLMEAVSRLERCNKEELVDYDTTSIKSVHMKKTISVERVVLISAIAGVIVGSILSYFIYGLPVQA